MRRLSSLVLGVLATPALGCSDVSTPTSVDRALSPIVNGEVSTSIDDGVVSISAKGHAACSASLIAPNVVLTALHCVADVDETDSFFCNADGTATMSTPEAGTFGPLVDPTTLEVRVGVDYHASIDAHGQRIYATDSTTICTDDLAVVLLDTDLAAPLVPLRFGRPVERAERVRIVGYGETELPSSSGRFSRSNVLVLDVGPTIDASGSRTAGPNTFIIGEGPCHGDSGGPALSETTGAALGLSSLISAADCTAPGVHNVYTQIPPFEALIRGALTDAGHEPILEASDSGGEAGTSNAGGAPGASNQGGSPGASGALNEAGVPGERESSGGSGGSAGADRSVTTAGTGASPADAGATPGSSQASSAHNDSGCSIGRGGTAPVPPARIGMLGGLLAALGLALRRRR